MRPFGFYAILSLLVRPARAIAWAMPHGKRGACRSSSSTQGVAGSFETWSVQNEVRLF